MKLLLDEMHAPAVAAELRAASLDVVAVASAPDLRGLPDEELLAYAAGEGRAIVTENVADFLTLAARWAAEGRAHAGLVLTHPRRFHRATLAYPGTLVSALRDFLAEPPVTGASWTWWL